MRVRVRAKYERDGMFGFLWLFQLSVRRGTEDS